MTSTPHCQLFGVRPTDSIGATFVEPCDVTDDARVMAKLAARWIREGDSDDPHHIARGRWLLNHALSRAPNDPEIKKLQRDYAGDTSQKADLNNR